jgi:glutamate/tyrosine decarboxylase-like PLP-dependent enzyme
MLDDMFDNLQGLAARPLWQAPTAQERARYREGPPRAPGDLAALHDQFMADIAPFGSGNRHPGFMGWVQGGGTAVGMLAEMLAGGLDANLGGRDHMPIEVERQVIAWMAELFGFPANASGIFLTGTSMANLCAMLIARDKTLGMQVRADGVRDPGVAAYASKGVHACVVRAMDMTGLGTSRLRLVETDADHRISLPALEAAIAADRANGIKPFLIVGSAGTVDVGAVDDLDRLADIAGREGCVFHVDGALGALGVLAPEIAPRLKGIERADSIALDFHKLGQAPYDAGFLLCRDAEAHKRSFSYGEAPYLRHAERGLAGGEWWPCDYGPDLSRGFRALKVWLTLKTYGVDAIGRVVAQTCALAQDLAARIEAQAELELMAPVGFNIVCFGYRGGDNAAIAADLQEAGRVAPSTTTLGGRTAIRAAIINHRTGPDDIEALVEGVLARGRAQTGGRT